MARKHKQGKSAGKSGAPHTLGTAALTEAANRALAGARHKDAIELCKELVKRVPSAENRDALAAAYAGRAENLAAKGMVKEAVAVWRNRADLCGKPLLEGPYPGWLRQIGDTRSLLQAYRACVAGAGKSGQSAERAALEANLATYVLAAPDAALTDLPADSPLVRNRAEARAALEAYCEGGADLDEALKAIPFRSPYRDLGRILKILSRMETDPVTAGEELQRIPADSPFVRFAAAATTALLPVDHWVPTVLALNDADRALALEFKNIPDALRPLVDEFLRLGERPSAAMLFDWLLHQRRRVPGPAVESLCRALLPRVPDRMRSYRQSFGALPHAEEERILALHAESRQEPWAAVDHWQGAIRALRHEDNEPERLRVALILRHLAELLPRSVDGSLHPDAIAWISQSLEYDPDDVDTYLRLLPIHREQRNLKAARALLDDALVRFPKNANILLEAIETALAADAFKKAVAYARKVLGLDPINPRVRSLLGFAHMAHARKQIKGRKIESARQELDEATEWLRAPADRTALKLLQGIAEIEYGRSGEGRRLLEEAMAETGGELTAYFHLAVEMIRLSRDPAKSLRSLGFSVPKDVAAEHVLDLVRKLGGFKLEPGPLRKVFALLHKTLQAGATHLVLEPDFLLVCETFQRHGLSELVRVYADAARKHHPLSPVFVYHSVNARYGTRPWSIPTRELRDLDRARDRAEQAGDRRLVVRIEQLLVPPGPEPFLPGGKAPFGDGMGPAEVGEIVNMMNLLGEDGILDFARRALGKKVFKELESTVGKDQLVPVLLEMLGGAIEKTGPMPPSVPVMPPKPDKKPAPSGPDISGQGDLFDE